MIFNVLWRGRLRPAIGTKAWIKTWLKRVWTFPTLALSTLAMLSLKNRGAALGDFSFLAGAKLVGRPSLLKVGSNSFIGNVRIHLHAPITIGDRVVINDRCSLFTASHDTRSSSWNGTSAPILLEDYVWVAEGVTILPGVRIGWGAVVGAGAVVSRDVARCEIVVGNPARPTTRRRPDHLDYDPVRSLAFVEAWLGPHPVQADK